MRNSSPSDPTDRGFEARDRWSFGPFVLDVPERRLLRGEAEIVLPERSFRLLEVLVRSSGRLVSKERLVTEVWNGSFVADTSLTEAMSKLRGALGDEARSPRFIQTIHGRGYRFIAPVHPAGAHPGPPVRRLRTAAIWSAAAALVAAAALLFLRAPEARTGVASSGTRNVPIASWPGKALQPLRELAGLLPRKGAAGTSDVRPRYRLAQVSVGGGQISRYAFPALPLNDLSVDPRGERFAFSMADGDVSDAWVLEPGRGELRRVATGGYFSDPVWTPDGRAVALASRRGESFDLVLEEIEGDGQVVLLEAPLDQFPESWARDGSALVYSEKHPESGFDLWVLRRGADATWTPEPLIRAPGDQAFSAMSPDGRFVAYSSREGSVAEIYVADLVRGMPAMRVSRNGGGYPFWSRDGETLHYVAGDEVWTVASSDIRSQAVRPARQATPVEGVYLAARVPETERFVVAVLD